MDEQQVQSRSSFVHDYLIYKEDRQMNENAQLNQTIGYQTGNIRYNAYKLRNDYANEEYKKYFDQERERIVNYTDMSEKKKKKEVEKLLKNKDKKIAEIKKGFNYESIMGERRNAEAEQFRTDLGNAKMDEIYRRAEAISYIDPKYRQWVERDEDFSKILNLEGGETAIQENKALVEKIYSKDEKVKDDYFQELFDRCMAIKPQQLFVTTNMAKKMHQNATEFSSATHILNVLNKMPLTKDRFEEKDPSAFAKLEEHVKYLQAMNKMNTAYTMHQASFFETADCHDMIERGATKGYFKTYRGEMQKLEKQYGMQYFMPDEQKFAAEKEKKRAEIDRHYENVNKSITNYLEREDRGTVKDRDYEGMSPKFTQAIKELYGDLDQTGYIERVEVGRHQQKYKAAIQEYNSLYGENIAMQEVDRQYLPTQKEIEFHKLTVSEYQPVGAKQSIGEPIFRSFKSFGYMKELQNYSVEHLKEMLNKLAAGFLPDEEQTSARTEELREQNRQGLVMLKEVSDKHYKNAYKKFGGFENWSYEKKLKNINALTIATANTQVDGNLYYKLGDYIGTQSADYLENLDATLYFNGLGMGYATLKQEGVPDDVKRMIEKESTGYLRQDEKFAVAAQRTKMRW